MIKLREKYHTIIECTTFTDIDLEDLKDEIRTALAKHGCKDIDIDLEGPL